MRATSAKVEFTTSCQFRGEPASTGGAPRVCLMLDASFQLTVPGSQSPLTVEGGVKLDFSTLKFEAVGRVPAGSELGPKQLQLEQMELFVTNAHPPPASCATGTAAASADGLSLGITAKGKVLGIPVSFTGAYWRDRRRITAWGRISARRISRPGTPTRSRPATSPLQHSRAARDRAIRRSSGFGSITRARPARGPSPAGSACRRACATDSGRSGRAWARCT